MPESAQSPTSQTNTVPAWPGYLLLVLTVIYIVCEASFNARLLDVVGASPTPPETHSIEVWGRSLSGFAVGLLVFQIALGRHFKQGKPVKNLLRVGLYTLIAGLFTYSSLQAIVDGVVRNSSPAFRSDSVSIALFRKELVEGREKIDGMVGTNNAFATPEGKAFLAIMPALAAGAQDPDTATANDIRRILRRDIDAKLRESVGGMHQEYKGFVKSIERYYEKYSRIRTTGDAKREARARRVWDDYESYLRRHHSTTPDRIPAHLKPSILRYVQTLFPFPDNWDLADYETFKRVVAGHIPLEKETAGITVNGEFIPAGLSFEEFFARPVIQNALSEKMKAPKGTTFKADYGSTETFHKQVGTLVADGNAKDKMRLFLAPVETFADGAKNANAGLEAARAALVPPIALFFSLIGLIGHTGKLSYLLASIVLRTSQQRYFAVRATAVVVPIAVISFIWAALLQMDNEVTQSRPYLAMQGHLEKAIEGRWYASALPATIHVIVVGQPGLYPISEMLRTRVMGGFDFGVGAKPQKHMKKKPTQGQ